MSAVASDGSEDGRDSADGRCAAWEGSVILVRVVLAAAFVGSFCRGSLTRFCPAAVPREEREMA